MNSLVAGVTLAASSASAGCGGGPTPTQPTQPTQDGCQIVAADPVDGSVLKAGIAVNITMTAQCTLSATAAATAIAGGVMLPSQNPTSTAARAISKGATTVSLTIPFVPPASETDVGFFWAIVYDVAGLPPAQKAHNGVDYKIR